MSTDLLQEIRQQKPFVSLAEAAVLNVGRTMAVLDAGLERVLKPHGISGTQYNVLRILRGAGIDGLCRNEIADRLVTRMPDVTRLLDRMEEADLVARQRDSKDRRLVTTRLTDKGRALVDELDAPINALHERQLGHLSEEQLHAVIDLMSLIRTSA
ncbi:MAG: MarR family transcriptional regulator [Gemmatimonadota bacterium]